MPMQKPTLVTLEGETDISGYNKMMIRKYHPVNLAYKAYLQKRNSPELMGFNFKKMFKKLHFKDLLYLSPAAALIMLASKRNKKGKKLSQAQIQAILAKRQAALDAQNNGEPIPVPVKVIDTIPAENAFDTEKKIVVPVQQPDSQPENVAPVVQQEDIQPVLQEAENNPPVQQPDMMGVE